MNLFDCQTSLETPTSLLVGEPDWKLSTITINVLLFIRVPPEAARG